MRDRSEKHAGELSRLIATHRRKGGWTQEELAERTGLSVRTVRNIESGAVDRPRAHTVRRLTTALGVDDRTVARLLADMTGSATGGATGIIRMLDGLAVAPGQGGERPSYDQLAAVVVGIRIVTYEDVSAGIVSCVV